MAHVSVPPPQHSPKGSVCSATSGTVIFVRLPMSVPHAPQGAWSWMKFAYPVTSPTANLVAATMYVPPVPIIWPWIPKEINAWVVLSPTVLNVPVTMSAQLATVGSPSTGQEAVSIVPMSMAVKFAQVMESVPPVSLGLTSIVDNVQSVLPPARHAIVMEVVLPASYPSQPLLTPMASASLAQLPTVWVVLPAIKTSVKHVHQPMWWMPTPEHANLYVPPTSAYSAMT